MSLRALSVAFVACCMLAGCSLAEPRNVDAQSGACVRIVEFDNVRDRDVFLAENVPAIVERFNPPRGTLYLLPHSADANLSVAVRASNCERPADLSPLVATSEVSGIRAEFSESFNVERDFADLLPPAGLRSDSDARRCVITAHAPPALAHPSFGLVVSEMTYGGMPSLHVLQVGDRLFVGSDENCDLTLRYVETVAEELGLSDVNPSVCPARSIAECEAL